MKQIDDLLKELGETCKEKRYSLATAESCTGGGLAYFISKNPQCSAILERGYVVYSISSKEEVLNVPSYILQIYGLVSKETAKEMAEGALKKSKAQISIALTGIDEEAAKDHASTKSGVVWISCAGIDKTTIAKRIMIKGGREQFCQEAILNGLKILLHFIL